MHTNAVRLLILIPKNTLLVNLQSIIFKTTTYTLIPVWLTFPISIRYPFQYDVLGRARVMVVGGGVERSSPSYVLQM